MRFFGLLATAALLAVGANAALTVIPDPKTSQVALPEPAPAATPKPATHKKKQPAKPKLTAVQRRDRAAAVTLLRGQGYRPVVLGDYAPDHVLRVLIGRGDGGRRAFFFAGTKFLGNDASGDSDAVKVVRAGNRSVALSYKLSDGSTSRVLFRWDGKKLSPQTAIPPAAARHAAA
jgi:hypothetical protein